MTTKPTKNLDIENLNFAELAKLQQEIEVRKDAVREEARRDLTVSREELSGLWQGEADFERAAGSLEIAGDFPEAEGLTPFLRQRPEIARMKEAIRLAEAISELEQAGRTPDPALTFGFRLDHGSDSRAFVAGVSLPIPLFNRNEAAVRSAHLRVTRARRELDAATAEATAAFRAAYEEMARARMSAILLRDDVLPAASEAFESARKGYTLGKFDYLVLLDAQQTLFDARREYLSALLSYHEATATLEGLIGRKLASLFPN